MLESTDIDCQKTENINGLMDYSIVIPVYNEEGSLRILIEEIIQIFEKQNGCFEIVLVNDASNDQTPIILSVLEREHLNIVRVINLNSRNGQTLAMRKGLDQSLGNVVITMDADLQNDPADIPAIIKKIQEGYDCVCGWRKDRQDTWLKAGLSKSGNILQRLFTGLSIHDVSCTLRAYRRDVVARIPLNWEGQHRFIPLSLSLQGLKITEVVSNHRSRQFGRSKYGHKRIFRVVKDFFRILKKRGKE
ncbi:MAG: glycosyltransferase family 2 protein [Candidatus Omnitrophica bacterium]|nr:glycosyltransferase family 2 protein [Candidatus Omnitrophota bacterium]